MYIGVAIFIFFCEYFNWEELFYFSALQFSFPSFYLQSYLSNYELVIESVYILLAFEYTLLKKNKGTLNDHSITPSQSSGISICPLREAQVIVNQFHVLWCK